MSAPLPLPAWRRWRAPTPPCRTAAPERGPVGRRAEGNSPNRLDGAVPRSPPAPLRARHPPLPRPRRRRRRPLPHCLVVAQAWLIAQVVAGAFLHHRSPRRSAATSLSCSPSSPAGPSWPGRPSAPPRGRSASAKSDLRRAAAERVADLGPEALQRRDPGQLTVLLTGGIDALDGYFSRYLPQLFLAVIVPVTIIAVVAGADWVSAVIIAVSLPLIPLFMALVGRHHTRPHAGPACAPYNGWPATSSTWSPGCPHSRSSGAPRHRPVPSPRSPTATAPPRMATLRLTFLSSLVLELLATVSVALVAVAVGLRLLGGSLDFRDALVRPRPCTRGLPAPAGARRQLPRQRRR